MRPQRKFKRLAVRKIQEEVKPTRIIKQYRRDVNNQFARENLANWLVFMCSASVLDIKGMDAALADKLVSTMYVRSILDLFRVPKDVLPEVMCDDIQRAKRAPLSKWLTALRIPGVTKQVAKKLAKRYSAITDIIMTGCNFAGCVPVDRVSGVIAWLSSNEVDEHILSRLPGLGIYPTSEVPSRDVSKVLHDEYIALSGKFSVPRDKIEELIRSNGGTPVKKVTDETTMLLTSKRDGKKYEAAIAKGVAVLSEYEFSKLFNSTTN